MMKYLLTSIAAVVVSGLLHAQDMKQGKHLTAAEYKELVAKDPVLQFIERVNDRAVKNPIWKVNYALALDRAFGEETSAHLRELGVESYDDDLGSVFLPLDKEP